MVVLLGVALSVVLLAWFVIFFIATNILHIRVDRSGLKWFFFIPQLTLVGFLFLAIAYSTALLISYKGVEKKLENDQK